jgi:hypothetical protein
LTLDSDRPGQVREHLPGSRIALPQITVSVSVTECETPVEVTVTGIVYVPAGVVVVDPEPPLPPEELRPALAQLDAASVTTTSSTSMASSFRRRRRASGKTTSPQSMGNIRHFAGPPSSAAFALPVEIEIDT